MSAIQSALSNIQAVKLVFAQGNLGADNALGGTGTDADQITHEGVLDISGSGGNIDPTDWIRLIQLTRLVQLIRLVRLIQLGPITNPTDPTGPTGPTDPTNPTGPTDPTELADPTKLTD